VPADRIAPRLARLPAAKACGVVVPVATGFRARLLGLALLDAEEAGPGLLIPRCRSVHTFGMRFSLDVVFLDAGGAVAGVHYGMGPRRAIRCAAAAAVLELPSKHHSAPNVPECLP